MIGRVLKIFSDFYYVDTRIGIVEAKLKSIIKKRSQEVYTGDFVELEQLNENSKQAFISNIKQRTCLLSRPRVANINRIIIVSALKEPELNFEQLNRYIANCEYHKIKPVLCFNKEDIINSTNLQQRITDIYEKLGYTIIFTSALKKTGINELKSLLKDNTTVLCGTSGAGKSSLINAVLNNQILKTGLLSAKTKRGMHTTRHCELITVDKNSFIVDTPGFSHLKFDFLLPYDIQKLFVEFKDNKNSCKFKNCLHLNEKDCAFYSIIKNMDKSRYESYEKFVREAKEYEDKISNQSIKNEEKAKYNQNKIMTKISHKKRELTRKTAKQRFYKEEIQDE